MEKVVSELNRLQTDGLIAAYAIGGAVAAQAYIAPMSTEDVDVFAVLSEPDASSLAPLRSIYADLIPRGAKENGPYLEIGGWPVQFLTFREPLYESAITHARVIQIGGQPARIMDPEHLAAIALKTGRAKDHLRLLEFISSGAINQASFEKLLERFGLSDAWKSFRVKFMSNE